MTERWRPVPGYGHYEVSDTGRVRSVDRWLPYRNTFRLHRGRELRPGRLTSGHLAVHLHQDAVGRSIRVHQLVLAAFVGPPPMGHEVRHLDGDPSNNNLLNLTYGTRSENRYDEVRHGVHYFANRTHCPQGHPYDEENTYRPPSRPGSRHCRACARLRNQSEAAKATRALRHGPESRSASVG
jgi:hypothetical protein